MLDEKPVTLELADTAGQEEYKRLRALSYPDTDIFLICYSVVDSASYDNISNIWIKELDHYSPNSIKIIVGTKIDLRDDPVFRNDKILRQEDGVKLKEQVGAHSYFECSAFTKEGLTEVFQTAAKIGKENQEMLTKKIVPKKKKFCTIL